MAADATRARTPGIDRAGCRLPRNEIPSRSKDLENGASFVAAARSSDEDQLASADYEAPAHRPRKRVRGVVAAESDVRRDAALQREGGASPDRGRAAS